MATAVIDLTDLDGYVTGAATVDYDGAGDGVAVVASDACEGLDRTATATFSAAGCASVVRTVFQLGLREAFTDWDFLVADGGTFHVLKDGAVVRNYYEFVGSDAGDSVVVIDGVDVTVAAGATVRGYFAEDISDIPTNNLRKIKIIGDVSLTIGARGTANETVEAVEMRFSKGFSRSWEKMCWHLHALTTAVLTGSQPTSCYCALQYCYALREVNFRDVDFSACETMRGMFRDDTSLETLDVSTWDFRACSTMMRMCYGCTSLTAVVGFCNKDCRACTTTQEMFCDCTSLRRLEFTGNDFSSVTDARYMFRSCSGCTFDGCDFSSVTDAEYMFGGGDSEHPVVVNNCDFRSLTSTYMLFFGGMLSDNPYDTTVVCSNCNFSGADKTYHMFSNIAHVDCHGCDFSNVTAASSMFNETDIFTTLSFTDNDLSSVTDASQLCLQAAELVSADFTGCDFSSFTTARYMFSGCSVLATLLFGTWDMSTLSDVGYMFNNCPLLTTVAGSLSNLRYSLDIGSSPLSRDSALVFLHALSAAAAEETPTLTLSSSTVALLTAEDIQIATDKGWTIATSE